MNRTSSRGDAHVAVADHWAEFYDLVEGDRSQMVGFYSSLLQDSVRSVLELACGTGAILAALAQRIVERRGSLKGIRIAGLDESSKMLAIAQRRNGGFEWVQGDMRSPELEGTFDLVLCPFNALQFCSSDAELLQAFRSVRRLLPAGGIFAFDIYNPNLQYLRTTHRNHLAKQITNATGIALEVREDASYDEASNIYTVNWRLQEEGRDKSAPLSSLTVRYYQYTTTVVDRLLAQARLVIRERFGDLDRSPFTADSKKQVLVCGVR